MFLRTDTLLPGRAVFGATPVSKTLHVQSTSSEATTKNRVLERGLLIALVVIGYILPNETDSTTLQNIWWNILGLIGFVGLLSNRRQTIGLIRRSYPLVILIILAVVSIAWSADPGTTARRSFALVDSALLSIYFVQRLGLKTFLDSLFIGIGIVAVMSLLIVILVPSIGIDELGEWQGCFEQKNGLAQAMVLGLITALCSSARTEGLKRILKSSAIGLFLVLLLGSRSGTSILVAVAIAVLTPTLLWSRQTLATKPRFLIGLVLCTSVCIALASTYGKTFVLNALGKDETLTSRTDVWQYALDAVNERPILGYGYKVFWLTHGAIGGDTGKDSVTWATQAHNGFIEIALDLGIIGEAAIVLFLIISIARAARFFWAKGDIFSAWPILVLTAFTLTNLSEATMLKYFDVTWVIFVAASLLALQRGTVSNSGGLTGGATSRQTSTAYSVSGVAAIRSFAPDSGSD